MKKGFNFIIGLFLVIIISSFISSQQIRCYYDEDGDLYGNYNTMTYFPTEDCGGIVNMICSPEALGTGGEDCTMIGFDCNDYDSSLGERCQDIYCYKDEDQDNYVIHNEYYIIHPNEAFYSETKICEPDYTDGENVASENDDCDDNNPSIQDNCGNINLIKKIKFNALKLNLFKFSFLS